MNFLKKLDETIHQNNSLLCVGLDPDLSKLPPHILKASEPLFEFNKAIIDATADLVCAFKPNSAFYEALGIDGLSQLKKTIEYLKKNHSDIPIVLDAKRGDIGNTSEMYAKNAFDFLGVDGITVNPYLGFDALEPFLKRHDKGIIILCRTSNPGAKDFQDLLIDNQPLYIHVAKKIVNWNKQYNNCLMVVSPTGKDLQRIREITPDMFFLVPGIGAQGGDLKSTLEQGLTKKKSGLIINSSRSIIYASTYGNFAESARRQAEKLRNEINSYR